MERLYIIIGFPLSITSIAGLLGLLGKVLLFPNK